MGIHLRHVKNCMAAESHDEEGTLTKVFEEEGATGSLEKSRKFERMIIKMTSEGATKDPGTSEGATKDPDTILRKIRNTTYMLLGERREI